MNHYYELSKSSKAKIKRLVQTSCANYDREYGCLPLDCDCYMFGIAYTNSRLCRYFEQAVLPLSGTVRAIFDGTKTKKCPVCTEEFPDTDRKRYCSEQCALSARRANTAKRVSIHRKNKS